MYLLVAFLLVMISLASYAYFLDSPFDTPNSVVTVDLPTLESFVIIEGDPINIALNTENMALGQGDEWDTTITTVTLTGGSQSSPEYCYNIDFNIATNNFEYTQASIPEILLTVEKNDIKIYNDYDITTLEGVVSVPTVVSGTNYKHSLSVEKNQSKTDIIELTVRFANLDVSQNINLGKVFKGQLIVKFADC